MHISLPANLQGKGRGPSLRSGGKYVLQSAGLIGIEQGVSTPLLLFPLFGKGSLASMNLFGRGRGPSLRSGGKYVLQSAGLIRIEQGVSTPLLLFPASMMLAEVEVLRCAQEACQPLSTIHYPPPTSSTPTTTITAICRSADARQASVDEIQSPSGKLR
jgi:hypothetical protein